MDATLVLRLKPRGVATALTDDTFEYDNTSYSVTQLFLQLGGGWLVLALDPIVTDATIARPDAEHRQLAISPLIRDSSLVLD